MAAGPLTNVSDSFSALTWRLSGCAAGSSGRAFHPSGSVPVAFVAFGAGAWWPAAAADQASPASARITGMPRNTPPPPYAGPALRIGRGGFPLQPFVHPADDVLQPLDAVPRLAGPRKLMRFAREADHDRRDFPILEGAEHLCPAFGRRRPVIGVPQNQHQRRRHIR